MVDYTDLKQRYLNARYIFLNTMRVSTDNKLVKKISDCYQKASDEFWAARKERPL